MKLHLIKGTSHGGSVTWVDSWIEPVANMEEAVGRLEEMGYQGEWELVPA